MAKSLILVRDSAGEKVLVNIANIVRVQNCDNPCDSQRIEILVKEPVTVMDTPIYYVDDELNKYYSPLTLEHFAASYA